MDDDGNSHAVAPLTCTQERSSHHPGKQAHHTSGMARHEARVGAADVSGASINHNGD
ncbi:MAG: hypothetical protein JSR21_22130 [Proteobacteria bacterium]|nr:hypothetical protein [Pseudomonadota bacterium]